jgi:hypothetical protein
VRFFSSLRDTRDNWVCDGCVQSVCDVACSKNRLARHLSSAVMTTVNTILSLAIDDGYWGSLCYELYHSTSDIQLGDLHI